MTHLKERQISDVEREYRNAKTLKDSRARELPTGGYLFRKADGTFRFFSKIEEAITFEFCQDELL